MLALYFKTHFIWYLFDYSSNYRAPALFIIAIVSMEYSWRQGYLMLKEQSPEQPYT